MGCVINKNSDNMLKADQIVKYRLVWIFEQNEAFIATIWRLCLLAAMPVHFVFTPSFVVCA